MIHIVVPPVPVLSCLDTVEEKDIVGFIVQSGFDIRYVQWIVVTPGQIFDVAIMTDLCYQGKEIDTKNRIIIICRNVFCKMTAEVGIMILIAEVIMKAAILNIILF